MVVRQRTSNASRMLTATPTRIPVRSHLVIPQGPRAGIPAKWVSRGLGTEKDGKRISLLHPHCPPTHRPAIRDPTNGPGMRFQAQLQPARAVGLGFPEWAAWGAQGTNGRPLGREGAERRGLREGAGLQEATSSTDPSRRPCCASPILSRPPPSSPTRVEGVVSALEAAAVSCPRSETTVWVTPPQGQGGLQYRSAPPCPWGAL